MYIESLIRLAEIISHFNEKGEKLIDEQFHGDTIEIIEAQSKFLANELSFKEKEPGPYTLGLGDFTITIFTPDQTEIAEWAAIARHGNWQNNYRFNSMYGLVKALSQAFEDYNKHIKDGSTSTQETTSKAED